MHCHLDLYPNPIRVVQECKERDLYILSVTTTPKAWSGTCKLAEGSRRIQTALGLHPQLAHQRSHELELFDTLIHETKYIGEVGLDGGKEFREHRDTQLKVFRHVLKAVNRAGGRIMTIHSRACAKDVLDELVFVDGAIVLHWFSGSHSELKRAVDMGCWFSVCPPMLNTRKGRDLVSMMPANRVLTESDGPFAKRFDSSMYPWDVCFAVESLGDLWKCGQREAEQVVFNNFKQLVGK